LFEFIDQNFNVVQRLRARAPWKFIDAPPGGALPRIKNHWARVYLCRAKA